MVTANVRFLSARIALAAGIAAGVLGFAPAATVELHAAPAVPATSCAEDQPCWDCTTMGNHVCGVELAAGENAYDEGAYVGGWN